MNHRDADKTNNRATNLEYVTSSENQVHSFQHGRQDCRGENNGQAKLTESDVREIKRILRSRKIEQSYEAIGKQFGVSGANIRAIDRGRSWKHIE